MSTMKDKTSATGAMVAHLAYIQFVQSSSLWSQTNLLSHSFTSYWCWWYDQYKNSPPIFSRCHRLRQDAILSRWKCIVRYLLASPPSSVFSPFFQRRQVWLNNPTWLIWCFLLMVRKPPSQGGNVWFKSRKHHHNLQVGGV